MDVTSLLNTASAVQRDAAASEEVDMMDQNSVSSRDGNPARCSFSTDTSASEKLGLRRLSGSKPPSRSRTPWDANGYALPLLDTKSTPALTRSSLFQSESPIESVSPKSPRHKCSDSQGSLSSYASSSSSLSHSRLSSMSTVGGIQPLGTIPDVSSLEIGSESAENAKQSRPRFGRDGFSSPIPTIEETFVRGTGRPGSPSDAILISKPQLSFERLESHDMYGPRQERRDSFSLLIPPDLSRTHKRTVSAPSFAGPKPSDRNFIPIPPHYQPIGSLPYSGDRESSLMDNSNISALAAGGSSASSQQDMRCLYSHNCNTGSALRKAISHIFGRNKLCTRMIPANIWVYWCRKHYQRTRYRNAQEYAKLQCDLVTLQIRKVQAWSDGNRQRGQSGVVQDWSLNMRKREKDRISGNRNKRSHDESDEEGQRESHATMVGTAVPRWLRARCGASYTSAEMVDIIQRLKEDINGNKLQQIPDIEILPTITSDDLPAKKKQKSAKQNKSSQAKSHQKSRSTSAALSSQVSVQTHAGLPDWHEPTNRVANDPPTRTMANLSIRSAIPYQQQQQQQQHRQQLRQQHNRSISFSTYAETDPYVFNGSNSSESSMSNAGSTSAYGSQPDAAHSYGHRRISSGYGVGTPATPTWSAPGFHGHLPYMGHGHTRHQSSPIGAHLNPPAVYHQRSHSGYGTDMHAYGGSGYGGWSGVPSDPYRHQRGYQATPTTSGSHLALPQYTPGQLSPLRLGHYVQEPEQSVVLYGEQQ